MVQELRLCASNAGDAGSIPGQELRSYMPRSVAKIKNGYCASPTGIERGKALSSSVFECCSDAGG